MPLKSSGVLSALLAENDLKPLSQNARPLMPLASSLPSSCLPTGPLRHLVQLRRVVEDERQVEHLELLDAERAELGERRREHLHCAELQRLHLFLVLVQGRIGVDLDLDLALGELGGALGEELGGLALGGVVGDDVAELDDDRRLRLRADGDREPARERGDERHHPAARCCCMHGLLLRRMWVSRAPLHLNAIATILRRRKAIWVDSGSCFGQTSWQASSDMQPNTPSSSPISS